MTKELIEVTFVSVWDGGDEIETKAVLNQETKKLEFIETAEPYIIDDEGEEVEAEVLDEQYIVMPNGEKLGVTETEEGDYLVIPKSIIFIGEGKELEDFWDKYNFEIFNEEQEISKIGLKKYKIQAFNEEDAEKLKRFIKESKLTIL